MYECHNERIDYPLLIFDRNYSICHIHLKLYQNFYSLTEGLDFDQAVPIFDSLQGKEHLALVSSGEVAQDP